MYGCDRYRPTIRLDTSKLNLRSPSGFPACHDFIILRNLILNRNIQVSYGSQCSSDCLFVNIQTNRLAIRQITDKTKICQIIEDLQLTLVEHLLVITANEQLV